MRTLLILATLLVSSNLWAQCGSVGTLAWLALAKNGNGDWTCTPVAGAGLGSVTSVGLLGTVNQITVTGSSPITASGSFTLSLPAAGVSLPGVTSVADGLIGAPSLQWSHTGAGKLGFYKIDNDTIGFPDSVINFIDSGDTRRFMTMQANNVNIGQIIHASHDMTWYNAAGVGSGNVVAILSDTNLLFGPFTGGGPYVGIVRRDADGATSPILSIDNNGSQSRDLRLRSQYYTTDTEVTCDATVRGKVTMVFGATMVADTFKICTKDGSDAYAWRTLI